MDVEVQETNLLSKQSWATSSSVPTALTLGVYTILVAGGVVASGSDQWEVYGAKNRYLPVPKWQIENNIPTDPKRVGDTWVKVFQITSEDSHDNQNLSLELTVPFKINYIRSRLGLRVSELAKIFDVDRQSIYAWLRSIYFTKDERKLKKFEDLIAVAQLVSQFFRLIPENICHLKVNGEMSLMNELFQVEINFEKITKILKLIPLTEQEQRRAKMRSSSVRAELNRNGVMGSVDNNGFDVIDLMTGKRKIDRS